MGRVFCVAVKSGCKKQLCYKIEAETEFYDATLNISTVSVGITFLPPGHPPLQ